MQTYAEYLETMKAYHFIPMEFRLWRAWQLHYHGTYKDEIVHKGDSNVNRTAEQIKTYREAALKIITDLGAVAEPEGSAYSHVIPTRAGPLLIDIGDDCCICTRFDQVFKVKALRDTDVALGDRLNPHSGKWNWMGGFSHDGDMHDLADFGRALKTLVVKE